MPEVDLPLVPLVTADWLAENLGRSELVIVDTRKGDGFASAHIPGARKLALDPLLHHPGRVEAPEVAADEMARLGVGRDTLFVPYDDGNNLLGARLWCVLRHYGHDRVRVLGGGWDGWVAARHPVTDQPAPEAPAGGLHGAGRARATGRHGVCAGRDGRS